MSDNKIQKKKGKKAGRLSENHSEDLLYFKISDQTIKKAHKKYIEICNMLIINGKDVETKL